MKPQETSPKPLPDILNGVASDGSDVVRLVGKEIFVLIFYSLSVILQ